MEAAAETVVVQAKVVFVVGVPVVVVVRPISAEQEVVLAVHIDPGRPLRGATRAGIDEHAAVPDLVVLLTELTGEAQEPEQADGDGEAAARHWQTGGQTPGPYPNPVPLAPSLTP